MFRILGWLLAILLAVAALGAGGMAWFAHQPISLSAERLSFEVRPGMTLHATSRDLEAAGARLSPWKFVLLGRVLGKAGNIKAGSYEIDPGTTPLDLLAKLNRGDVAQDEIVFVEGWTFRQIRGALDAHPRVRHDSAGMDESQILQRLGAAERTAEGVFFPDTYLFPRNGSDLDILHRAYATMQRHLSREWEGRGAGLPLASPYHALILASIVEKETGQATERALVASVFINRLKAGMPLQTDPTVIYGIGERFDGNLRKRHLQQDTAFNSYTRTGLPPSPIAAPGLASLQAALHPADSRFVYFVARGDGSSEFSIDLSAHNRAVNRYQKRKR
ncbi:MAG: endolytic transglycosylase MltG [Betaproteobacteria bacterium]|nr:endolytic transglycosylase MltG [Betaproteobacteria bacterium]